MNLKLGDKVTLKGETGEITVVSRTDNTCIVTFERTENAVRASNWVKMSDCILIK